MLQNNSKSQAYQVLSDTKYNSIISSITPNSAADLLRYARSRTDIISLAQGESDNRTPDFIVNEVTEAMLSGRTRYSPPLGLPQLREELSLYYKRIFNTEITENRIYVCGSGSNAVHRALTSIITPNAEDEVIAVTPMWKNLAGMIELAGAAMKEVRMTETSSGWSLDTEKLFSAYSSKTKAILIVTPSNPTGWTASAEEIKTILDFARQKGIWVISDEVYSRMHFSMLRTPSFLDYSSQEDLLYVVGSFSKDWAMTGWRLGWLIGPVGSDRYINEIALYENLCLPEFTQYGAIAALKCGEDFIAGQKAEWLENRNLVSESLSRIPYISWTGCDATFYAFIKIHGTSNSSETAKQLIDTAGLSLAPGAPFGSGCNNRLRLCFAPKRAKVAEALHRLELGLQQIFG